MYEPDRLQSAKSSGLLWQNGLCRKRLRELNMHLPALSISAIVLAIVIVVASCSSSNVSIADNDFIEFVGVPSEEVEWTPIPEGDGILTATLVGDPGKHGPLVARYSIPPNMEIVPHTHHEVRSYTVLSGVWELGFGKKFDPRGLRPFPQGSYYRLPAGVPHYQRAGPEGAIIQIESIGPDSFDPIE